MTESNPIDHLGVAVSNDFIKMMLGEKIGEGLYRDVYAAINGEDVFKIERSAKSFSNVREWEVWYLAGPDVQKWLAPCVEISPCGTVLIQKRILPIARLPKRVPNFLSDLRLPNWGTYKGRVVCCDYANHLLISNGLHNAKLKTLAEKKRTRP